MSPEPSGTSIELKADSLLVFVGPNNAGKSAALTDIKVHLGQSGREPVVIRNISLVKDTTTSEIKDSLSDYYRPTAQHYQIGSKSVYDYEFAPWGNTSTSGVGFLFDYLVSDLTTQSRLLDCQPQPSVDSREIFSSKHPFQSLYRDETLQKAVSNEVRRAFKSDLIVHMAGGNQIPLYIGDAPDFVDGENSVSRTYLDRVEKLNKLEEQGDGVRSYVSIVSRVMTERRSIQLIDEPEAFCTHRRQD